MRFNDSGNLNLNHNQKLNNHNENYNYLNSNSNQNYVTFSNSDYKNDEFASSNSNTKSD
jgi:hypothetical protein